MKSFSHKEKGRPRKLRKMVLKAILVS